MWYIIRSVAAFWLIAATTLLAQTTPGAAAVVYQQAPPSGVPGAPRLLDVTFTGTPAASFDAVLELADGVELIDVIASAPSSSFRMRPPLPARFFVRVRSAEDSAPFTGITLAFATSPAFPAAADLVVHVLGIYTPVGSTEPIILPNIAEVPDIGEVPLPGALVLLASGLGLLAAGRWRRGAARGRSTGASQIQRPPSTSRTTPVTMLERGEAR